MINHPVMKELDRKIFKAKDGPEPVGLPTVTISVEHAEWLMKQIIILDWVKQVCKDEELTTKEIAFKLKLK